MRHWTTLAPIAVCTHAVGWRDTPSQKHRSKQLDCCVTQICIRKQWALPRDSSEVVFQQADWHIILLHRHQHVLNITAWRGWKWFTMYIWKVCSHTRANSHAHDESGGLVPLGSKPKQVGGTSDFDALLDIIDEVCMRLCSVLRCHLYIATVSFIICLNDS